MKNIQVRILSKMRHLRYPFLPVKKPLLSQARQGISKTLCEFSIGPPLTLTIAGSIPAGNGRLLL